MRWPLRPMALTGAVAVTVGLAAASTPTAAGARTASAAPIAAVNSVWVWHSHTPKELASDAAYLQLSRVYLFVGSPSHAANVRIKRTVTNLHAEGVAVYALGGQPSWALHHKPAIAWAKRALRLAPFDGLHLDVEPYALKGWKTHQQADIAAYLGLLDKIGPMAGPLDVDVQFAMGAIGTPDGTFGDDILARVDGVTVMSYRDTAFGKNSMWSISQDWLTRATRADKPVWLAAETNRVPGCPYCTFFDDGQARMSRVLTKVYAAAAAKFATFQGFAVEDLDGWQLLGP